MKYPSIYFSCHNSETYRGAKEWSIWRHLSKGDCHMLGVAYKVKGGLWQANIGKFTYNSRTLVGLRRLIKSVY